MSAAPASDETPVPSNHPRYAGPHECPVPWCTQLEPIFCVMTEGAFDRWLYAHHRGLLPDVEVMTDLIFDTSAMRRHLTCHWN